MAVVEWRLETFEREKKRNNTAISGLELTTNNEQGIIKGIEEFVKEKLWIDAKVKSAYQINNRIIIAEVETYEKKNAN